MITLITGSPGSGKTLYCIDKLIQPVIGTFVPSVSDDGSSIELERRIFTNINKLMLDHELIDGEWVSNLHENKVTGSVVVIDEVQRFWPNRPHGAKKPPSVEYLETHRHDGIDLVIITQHPTLLDPAVRALVGRHLHVRRIGSSKAASVYEWDACSNALNFKNAFKKTVYKYNKKVFDLYKSAEVHTKQKRAMPFVFWVALAGVAGSLVMVPRFLGNVAQKQSAPVQDQAAGGTSPAPGPVAAASGPVSVASAPGLVALSLTPSQYLATFKSRVDGLPHTAPRYDQLTQPSRVPYPAACITSQSKGCHCFDQDGYKMLSVPENTCMRIVEHGLFFDFEPDPRKLASRQNERQARAGDYPTRADSVVWRAPARAPADSGQAVAAVEGRSSGQAPSTGDSRGPQSAD